MENDTIIRAPRAEDLNLIYSTWLRGLYYGNSFYNRIDKDLFFDKYKVVIKTLLERPSVTVSIMCFEIDQDTVLGYSVREDDKLHWLYVKEAWRKMGIAKRLVPLEVTSYSHYTNQVKRLVPSTWTFNPFL